MLFSLMAFVWFFTDELEIITTRSVNLVLYLQMHHCQWISFKGQVRPYVNTNASFDIFAYDT